MLNMKAEMKKQKHLRNSSKNIQVQVHYGNKKSFKKQHLKNDSELFKE